MIDKPLRILMISDLETRGGAAIAATRLADGLAREGVEIIRLVSESDGKQHVWRTIARTSSRALQRRVLRRLFPNSARQFDELKIERSLQDVVQAENPDVINIHNIHGAYRWGSKIVRKAVTLRPTVWTLHDMWAITGRCSYSHGCSKYLTGCDASCPTPNEYPSLEPERIASAWQEKYHLATSADRLSLVTPSQWLSQCATNGMWSGRRVETIPYGLPLEMFEPMDRMKSREQLGIAPNTRVLLTVAESLNEERKGAGHLVKALTKVEQRPLHLLTVGGGAIECQAKNVTVQALGYIGDFKRSIMAFNAADALVHPATEDNLPNVVLEAMACGTPTIGFPIGGVVDMVRPGRTGWLASAVSVDALATAIDRALVEISSGQTFREQCRAIAEAEYSLPLQAERYVALFRRMLGGAVIASKHVGSSLNTST